MRWLPNANIQHSRCSPGSGGRAAIIQTPCRPGSGPAAMIHILAAPLQAPSPSDRSVSSRRTAASALPLGV